VVVMVFPRQVCRYNNTKVAMRVDRHYRGIINCIGNRDSIVKGQVSKFIGVKN